MTDSSSRRLQWIVLAITLAVVVGLAALLLRKPGLPRPGTPLYEQYVEAFQVGVAALDADVPQVAEQHLTRAVELIPEEPAGWADRGLLYLRTGRLPEATQDLERAERLAPEDPDVQKLLGVLDQRRGRFGEAAVHLRKALERDPDDVKALYLLSQVVNQEQLPGSDAEYQRLMEQILTVRPRNLRVLADRLRVAVRRGDVEAVRDTGVRFRELAPEWTEQKRSSLEAFDKAVAGPLGPESGSAVLRFSNVLRAEPQFQQSSNEIDPQTLVGDSLETFLRLAPARHAPAPPDTELSFTPRELEKAPAGRWDAVLPVWLNGESAPAVFVTDAKELRCVGEPAGLPTAASTRAIVPIDWNNDFRTDLFLTSELGPRFYQQQKDGSFTDVTGNTGLADEFLKADCDTALSADVDLDGDLDLGVSRQTGAPAFLRNNFDGTFTGQALFDRVSGPVRFAWADFDHDGAPDAAMLDARSKLHVFANERSGRFIAWPTAPLGQFRALTVVDANDDGVLDLVALREDGALVSIADRGHRAAWDVVELARWKVPGDQTRSISLLIAADLDNNGAIDLLASGPEHSAVWLGAGGGKLVPLPAELPPRVFAAADLRSSGRLDLLALDQNGRPLVVQNTGRQNYHWQTIRPRAASERTEGDNRINSFGIGGEVEIRTGTHVVKQPIVDPVVHVGLGQRPRADVVRIVWPNGAPQVEFSPPVDQTLVAVQRLKGSCPFLFAWNGNGFAFVTDFMWSTPLGMYINASDKGGFIQTTDWVKVSGDQLVARDGVYELRVQANLWETHFFDQLALLAVDHPADTELYIDERFYMEPAAPALHLMDKPCRVARAWDHHGRDATAEVLAVDGVHLDRAGRGIYQGVTQEHWVEVDLGDDAPTEGPLWLLARGWVHPTDSSVNHALEQGRHDRPHGLVLEIPDGHGGWKPGRERLGFPAGKNKTILVRLDGLDGPGVSRRFRLRTNMEIYWDALQYAHGRDDVPLQQRNEPVSADLGFRGIVAMTQAGPSSPELPHYDQIVARGQYWRDLIGFHTRYGDVRELLELVDDRYVILCGGDEITFRFTVPGAPQTGWKRDFVWIADGWVKDGDFNTRFGKTVLPLPAHGVDSYNTPPGRLEDDPVYQRHARDWETYHTRYVTPDLYEQGLRTSRHPSLRTARTAR
jgi:Tfp pilus assembly protein PilF